MESEKPNNINWKIAFSPKQNIIILYDFLFFYTQSLASLISKGEQISSYNEKLYYPSTRNEVIEARIGLIDRKMDGIEKLCKLRRRSIIWFKVFVASTALYFIGQEYLYFSFLMLLGCLVSLIFSIPLVRLHSFFENDVRKRLTKYRMHLSSEIEKISKAKKKEDIALKVPISADSKTLGALYNILNEKNLIEKISPKNFESFALDTFISSKKGTKFKERTLIHFFSDRNEEAMKLYKDIVETIQESIKIKPIEEAVPDENANRLFYHLKNSSLEFQIPFEQLEVLVKVFCHKVFSGDCDLVRLNNSELTHLRNLHKLNFSKKVLLSIPE